MKFISLFVFVAALAYTWSLSRREAPVAESVHVGIQDDLKNIIHNYIEDHAPGAKNIQFERMWTETLEGTKVKAHFVYSFVDDKNTRLEIDGEALLNKISENEEEVKYSFDELKIQNQSIVFDEPMNIVAGSDEGEEAAPPPEEEQHP